MRSAAYRTVNRAPPATLIQIREVDVSLERVRIRVLVHRPVLFTAELPGFAPRLLEFLPTLRSTICHNEQGLSFIEELHATEMGHVVEHVVLALLAQHDVYAKGTTEWNWFEEPEGTFTITITGDVFDSIVVGRVVQDALFVLEPLVSTFCEADRDQASWMNAQRIS